LNKGGGKMAWKVMESEGSRDGRRRKRRKLALAAAIAIALLKSKKRDGS